MCWDTAHGNQRIHEEPREPYRKGDRRYICNSGTLVFKGEHAENENWSLVQDRTGQVGYAPAGFLVVILDTTTEEQESDTTKKGQENSTEENRIGQEGELFCVSIRALVSASITCCQIRMAGH